METANTAPTVRIVKVNRRYYAMGPTYPIKDDLRAAGFKWDRDQGAWWTGKAALAEEFNGKTIQGASYTKLPDGTWGIRVTGTRPEVGDRVTVTKSSGQTKEETVKAIVDDSGDCTFTCTVEPKQRAKRKAPRVPNTPRVRRCRAPGCSRMANEHAPHHLAMGGFCGWCAHDEYDC